MNGLQTCFRATRRRFCGDVATTLVYDSVHHDYHNWNADEDRRYREFMDEHHRTYREFSRRPPLKTKVLTSPIVGTSLRVYGLLE